MIDLKSEGGDNRPVRAYCRQLDSRRLERQIENVILNESLFNLLRMAWPYPPLRPINVKRIIFTIQSQTCNEAAIYSLLFIGYMILLWYRLRLRSWKYCMWRMLELKNICEKFWCLALIGLSSSNILHKQNCTFVLRRIIFSSFKTSAPTTSRSTERSNDNNNNIRHFSPFPNRRVMQTGI